MASMHSCNICIVGAGLAGLAAAKDIVAATATANFNIVILEARDRVGGRTQTVEIASLNNNVIDVGAQWIGATHRELLSLIKEYNLQLIEQYYSPSTATNRLTECINYHCGLLSLQESQEIQKYMDLIEELSSEIDIEQPWMHPNATSWDSISLSDHCNSCDISSNAVKDEILLFAQTVMAYLPSKISFLFFLFYVKSGGGMEALGDGPLGAQKWRLEGGMMQLSQLIMHELAATTRVSIFYNEPVISIVNDNSTTCDVTTSNGKHIVCKHVIFCIPPSLLTTITFTPELPIQNQELFMRIKSGKAIKIYIAYATDFWRNTEQTLSGNIHFTELGYVHNLFHSSMTGSLVVAGEERKIYSLVGLITGQAAIDFELLSVDDRRNSVITQLHNMYRHDDALDYLHYEEKVWSQEQYSGGCFACVFEPDGTFTRLGHCLNGRSVATRGIHFACTETSNAFYGYMEGAIRSGKRAAIEVINSLK